MGYLLLTGATGLLGSYLVRDLTERGVRLAVLVRPSKMASARQRVESLVERWERLAGHPLARPVVLSGHLNSADLGLGADGLEWVKSHCSAIMHNAASLTFYSKDENSEPWISNLHGTRHVLEFARQAGIREFHHVSTAYVCGTRRERIFEHELNVGQTPGNDYESSKLQSEQMVRDAAHLDSVTVYRPGIIVGDSQDGYTTTFHGFYVPLKLLSTLLSKTAGLGPTRDVVKSAIQWAGFRLRQILNLAGNERKNFVPVDWVSGAMTDIYTNRANHGSTYHLTPNEPIPVALFQEIMEEVYLKHAEIKYAESKHASKATSIDWKQFEQYFIDQMGVYRSYWGDDPIFDTTNIRAACPNRPCPEMDRQVFTVMCEYAFQSNFGWPRPPLVTPALDVESRLESATSIGASLPSGDGYALGLDVTGQGGGQWEVLVSGGRVVAASPGLGRRSTATYYLNTQTFGRLAGRELTAAEAIDTGRVLIEGNGVPPAELVRALGEIVQCGQA